MITKYNSLTELLKEHTPTKNADQDATKILKHFRKNYPTATHVVLFVNHDFNSSQFGAWTCMVIGPGQTFATLEEVDGKHLHDLPSQRQYPAGYIELPRDAV